MIRDRAGVLCAGSVVVDLSKTVADYPARNRMTVIDDVVLSTGGPGMNMAVNLRLLDDTMSVWLAGAVGDDANGRFVRAECDRLGIDHRSLHPISGAATSFTDCMVEREGGTRTMFHHPGAGDRFEPGLVPVSSTPARILHLGAPGIHRDMDRGRSSSGSDPGGSNGWSQVLASARAAGLWTNLELVDQPPEQMRRVAGPCLPHLDSIIINELEAGALVGLDGPHPEADAPVDWDRLETMAERLVASGVNGVAVVHFPAGAVAVDRSGGRWRQPSVRLPAREIRSAVGAGDAFAAGTLLGLHEGWAVDRCLRLGVAVAAASLRGTATSDGIGRVEWCLTEAERFGFRSTGSP